MSRIFCAGLLDKKSSQTILLLFAGLSTCDLYCSNHDVQEYIFYIQQLEIIYEVNELITIEETTNSESLFNIGKVAVRINIAYLI